MATLITVSGAKTDIGKHLRTWQEITQTIGAEYFAIAPIPFSTDIIAKQPIVGDVIIATREEIA